MKIGGIACRDCLAIFIDKILMKESFWRYFKVYKKSFLKIALSLTIWLILPNGCAIADDGEKRTVALWHRLLII